MAKRGNDDGLTDKQRRFVDEYLIDTNATQAAIRAGYSRKTAQWIGPELLTKTHVQAAVAAKQCKIADKLEIKAERVLQEEARIGFCDLRKLFNGDGTLKPVHDWPDDAAAAVSSIKVTERTDDGGAIASVKEVKFWDKNAAIDKLMKHLGLYEKDNKQSGDSKHLTQVRVVFVPPKEVAVIETRPFERVASEV